MASGRPLRDTAGQMRRFQVQFAALAISGATIVAALVPSAGAQSAADAPPPGTVTMVQTADPNVLEIRVATQPGDHASDLLMYAREVNVVFNERKPGLGLVAGPGCKQAPPNDLRDEQHRVACTPPTGKLVGFIKIVMGAGNDTISGDTSAIDVRINGGAGNDALDALPPQGSPFLPEKYPLDVSSNAWPKPRLRYEGGSGNDTLVLTSDKAVGVGGTGGDTIRLIGTNGTAAGGDDADLLDARKATGPTMLNGGKGDDRLLGSKHRDTAVGGFGRDAVLTGAGDDRVFVRDGVRDPVNCGGDADQVTADVAETDKTVLGCEKVFRSAHD